MDRKLTARLGNVVQVERFAADADRAAPIVEVQVAIGDETITAHLLLGPGCDALPLPGDEVLLSEGEGEGETYAMAFADPKNEGTAEEGENRTFARDEDGNIACEIWLKKTGGVSIKSIRADGTVEINGVIIDQQGNITAPGEVQAMVGTPEIPQPGVKLSTHLHPTAVGPTSPPTPGT